MASKTTQSANDFLNWMLRNAAPSWDGATILYLSKALAPAIGSPIDAAFLPLLPDKAEAAIGAKRKANNDALLAILMEL